MSKVNVLVLRTAGINCDEEVMHCWRLAGAQPTLIHLNELIAQPNRMDDAQIVTLPGGFSYGDDIGAGVIMAQRMMRDLAPRLHALVERGGGILGICNGFQVLVKAGLLPGATFDAGPVTVTYNDSAKFEARWVRLKVCTDRCPFLTQAIGPGAKATATKKNDCPDQSTTAAGYLDLPIEHAEGRVVTSGESVVKALESSGHIALRYVDEHDHTDQYPANPNGSEAGVAGLCDATGRVLGLMPHPDRHFEHTHHPYWTRRKNEGTPDGLSIFRNAVAHWGIRERT